ncbi:MAG: hypothetical protein ACLP0H_22355 [Terriglobales bacterium]
MAWLSRALGFVAAAKVVAAMSVLIFFWGAFALISIVTRRARWFLVPAIAMVAYGWTFQMGFVNYDLSLGFSFWVIALTWRGRALDWIFALALSGLVLSAHLKGFMWLVGTLAYIKLWQRMTRWRSALPTAALLAILGTHFYIAHTYRTYDPVLWHVL